MEKQLEQINTKVDRIEREVTLIAENHIPHIYERMGKMETSVKKLRGVVKKWNWKMWSAVVSAIASIVGILLTLIRIFLGQ